MVRPIDNILKSASIGPALCKDVRAALTGLAHCVKIDKEWYAIVVGDTCGDDQRQGAIRTASIPDAVVQSVKRLLAAVQQQRRIEAAYVYGSQVKGTATQWSDIDLAVISPDFSPDLSQERLALMCLAAQIDDRIEPHPFTPQDFNASNPLASEIRKTGVRVA